MEGVIISGLSFSAALFFTGIFCGAITLDDLKNDTKAQLLFVFCVFTISVNATLLCMNINKCCFENSKAGSICQSGSGPVDLTTPSRKRLLGSTRLDCRRLQ